MTTPYMSLLLPEVSATLGPLYATENNDAFGVVDSHDHTSGKGVQVPSEGLNINGDLPFNGYNLTEIRASIYDPQDSPIGEVTDIGCLYVSGVDLYYNDVDGNQIQLTAGGALNASSIGGIGGDYATSDATCFYTAATQTFSFWQDSNKSALMDVGTILLRRVDNTSSAAITIKPSTSLSVGWTLTLPTALPVSTTFVAMDSSGNMTFTNSLVSLALSAGLTIGTSLTVGTTLDVTGAATFVSTVGVTGILSVTAKLTFTGANLGAGVAPDANTLYGDSVPKAWGFIASAGSILGGFNISSVAKGGTGIYQITFRTALSNNANRMACVVTADGTNLIHAVSNNISTTRFDVRLYNSSDALVDENFYFIAMGNTSA